METPITLPCPLCATGRVEVMRMEKSIPMLPGVYVVDKTWIQEVLQPCTVVACNACEFIQEIDPLTGVLL